MEATQPIGEGGGRAALSDVSSDQFLVLNCVLSLTVGVK